MRQERHRINIWFIRRRNVIDIFKKIILINFFYCIWWQYMNCRLVLLCFDPWQLKPWSNKDGVEKREFAWEFSRHSYPGHTRTRVACELMRVEKRDWEFAWELMRVCMRVDESWEARVCMRVDESWEARVCMRVDESLHESWWELRSESLHESWWELRSESLH
jgi:hypothetical protein